ncbi:DUF1152 domain-containing protein [Polyangium fumosum]|nr:DUF1152 domain-containing protein [Polyangium fumosum]
MHPTFLARLADPSIKTVLLCGCGGGFDFLQGATLLPELERLGKRVILGSYSFGQPERIDDAAVVYTAETGAVVKQVLAHSSPPPDYGPEVHLASFLDQERPKSAPHFVYAYYARSFTVPALRAFYAELVQRHEVDAVILVDGGSDSLMRGDEEGLGDPIEDAVSVGAVASLEGVKLKLLCSIGLGADRFNGVSDAASLRAIAELTKAGGFLGAVSLEPTSPGFDFYKRCIELRIPNPRRHAFRRHVGTRSDGTWARVPTARGHRFRCDMATRSQRTHPSADPAVCRRVRRQTLRGDGA